MRPILRSLSRSIRATAACSLGAVLLAGPVAAPVVASSHAEAPGTSQDRAIDCTDVYAFTSPDAVTTVTLAASYFPMEEPSGGPNYYGFADDALYEIHVDNNGDTIEDITFQFEFTTTTKNVNTFLYDVGPVTYDGVGDTYTNLNVEQRYTLTRVVGDRRTGVKTVLATNVLVAPNNVGPKTFPGSIYDTSIVPAAIKTLGGGIKTFAGPRDDPFFLFLGRVFDLINIDPVLPGGNNTQCGAVPFGDHLAGFNCHSLVLQVPKSLLTSDGSPATNASLATSIIGVWSTASRKQVKLNRTDGKDPIQGGAWTQVSRLGMPLVNEVVIPRKDKNKWNYTEPKDDAANFLPYVQTSELAVIINSLFPTVLIPPAPRSDLVTVFLTGVPGVNEKGLACEYLRLNMATPVTVAPNRMGLIAGDADGYPNGRRLTDDVVDISLQVVIGHLVPGFSTGPIGNSARALGDTVCVNDKPFLAAFPYLASPHDGVTRVH